MSPPRVERHDVVLPVTGRRGTMLMPFRLAGQTFSGEGVGTMTARQRFPSALVRDLFLHATADDAFASRVARNAPCAARAGIPAWRRIESLLPRIRRSPLRLAELIELARVAVGGSITGFRDTVVWFGGPTPETAFQVAPPPDAIAPLLNDLLDWFATTGSAPMHAAAVVHAQFVLVHPLSDGNGRMARLLAAHAYARASHDPLWLAMPFALMRTHSHEYQRALERYCAGAFEEYFGWWQQALEEAQRMSAVLCATSESMISRLSQRGLALATARRILALSLATDLLDTDFVSARAGCSRRLAALAIDALRELGWNTCWPSTKGRTLSASLPQSHNAQTLSR